MSTSALLSLCLVVVAAFTVEASLGFGATVIAVAVGAFFLPVSELLPAFIPVNLVLSAYLAFSYRAHVDRSMLFRRVLPFMLVGIPVGLTVAFIASERVLRGLCGGFVAILATIELRSGRRAERVPPIPKLHAVIALLLAGVMHGAFATGGPLVVYVMGRSIDDKRVFRATLSLLWFLLSVVLVTTYAVASRIDQTSMMLSAKLLPALALGLFLGERLHDRIPEAAFKRGVFALLFVTGVVTILLVALR